MKKPCYTTCLLICLGLTSQARAGVIYDNGAGGASSVVYGFLSDFDDSFSRVVFEAASPFSLSAPSTVTGVNWTGFYALESTPPLLDDFTLQFFADDNGLPAETAFFTLEIGHASRTDSGFDLFISEAPDLIDVFEYSASFTGPSLESGITYWFSVVNFTPGVEDDWAWAGIPEGSRAYRRDGGPWTAATREEKPDYRIFGVPEPATTSLFAIGFIGFSQLRRRRTRQVRYAADR